MELLRANKRWLVNRTITITSGVYSVLAMVALWVDFTELFFKTKTILRIVISLGILLFIALIVFLGCIHHLKTKNRFTVFTSKTGHDISIQFGDILKYPVTPAQNRVYSIIIPFNRCFDTLVDDFLIARSSIHGQFLTDLYGSNSFSPDSMNRQIQKTLACVSHETLSESEKPSGNRERYPVGTIVNVDNGNKRYFLFGYTALNKDLKASSSKEEYVVAIQRLIEYCDTNAQGGEVCMPLIGTGLSRIGVNKNDVLKYLFYSFLLNQEHLSFDLTIVIPQSVRDTISIYDLK